MISVCLCDKMTYATPGYPYMSMIFCITAHAFREDLYNKLTKEFRDITVKTGDALLYNLGVNVLFDRSARTIHNFQTLVKSGKN